MSHSRNLNGPLAVGAHLGEASFNWLPGGELPPALHTGHRVIDFEHSQLLGCIHRVRAICTEFVHRDSCEGCVAKCRSHCEEDLVGLLGDLLAFVLDHFRTEESLMRQSVLISVERALCEAHIEDHANISGKVQEIIAALSSGNHVRLVRELDVLLQRWVGNHIAFHDVLLARCIDLGSKPLTVFR